MQTSEMNVDRAREKLANIAYIHRNDFLCAQPYVLYGKCLLMHELDAFAFLIYIQESTREISSFILETLYAHTVDPSNAHRYIQNLFELFQKGRGTQQCVEWTAIQFI